MVVTRLNRSAVRFGAYKNGEPIGVATADEARLIASEWLASYPYVSNISYGLPEVDDRYGAWRIALLNITTGQTVGEIMISCKDGSILQATETVLISRRLKIQEVTQTDAVAIPLPIGEPTGADICYGDARQVLKELASGSIHLVITSPPYFNAKPEYSEYEDYESYLSMLREVFEECHRVLAEGRFLIVNLSPVLIRRAKRSESSRRIPVPFHVNSIIESVGYDFIDDIIWVKPAGAGWNTGRGRRFAADRHPLQYKPVPITEYFLVYRK
ncbi:MAG TPA: site-specific DNA-methyltransferase, partial [Dehalococcoidia bacterium]|nr:site-specific DNA-methyltransferase [Dehalococcoidia bacterium]